MPADVFTQALAHMAWITLLLSLPPLGVALVVGLVIGLLQAITSIQEQTLTFVPKIIAIVALYVVGGAWMLRVLMDYAYEVFTGLVRFGAL